VSEPTPEQERGPRRVYASDAIEVHWEPKLCIHIRNCVRGLPQVFDPAARPWVAVEAADPERVAETVLTCPTGALHFRRLDGGPQERAAELPSVEPRPNGPLFVRGHVRIVEADGRLIREDTRVALCRCGASGNKPFCDGSHRRIGFQTAIFRSAHDADRGDPMRAFALDGFDEEPRLRDDLPTPSPGTLEVLVRVRASSVNGADVAIAGGLLKDMVEHEFPVTLGRDFAGVVEQVGEGVSRYQVDDEVFGFLPHANPSVHDGSWAELIAVPEDNSVAAKPRNLEMAHAGAAPLAGITALAAFDALAPEQEEKVLVIGAAGGVGSFFVQLAANAGAQVLAPALVEDTEHLRELGVDETFDRNADLETAVRERHPDGVDAILDVVSFAPQDSLLAEGGRLASPLGAAGEAPGRFNLIAQPTPENLQRLAGLLDDGTLRVPIQKSYEFTQAAEALRAFPSTHTRGKLSITVG
jgi:NADPH2:quinone reductase